jgi:hypothetical protein
MMVLLYLFLPFNTEASFQTMDRVIDSRFERVENALAKLISSISTYNPSPAFATDLVAADAELSHGLEQREFRLLVS